MTMFFVAPNNYIFVLSAEVFNDWNEYHQLYFSNSNKLWSKLGSHEEINEKIYQFIKSEDISCKSWIAVSKIDSLRREERLRAVQSRVRKNKINSVKFPQNYSRQI